MDITTLLEVGKYLGIISGSAGIGAVLTYRLGRLNKRDDVTVERARIDAQRESAAYQNQQAFTDDVLERVRQMEAREVEREHLCDERIDRVETRLAESEVQHQECREDRHRLRGEVQGLRAEIELMKLGR